MNKLPIELRSYGLEALRKVSNGDADDLEEQIAAMYSGPFEYSERIRTICYSIKLVKETFDIGGVRAVVNMSVADMRSVDNNRWYHERIKSQEIKAQNLARFESIDLLDDDVSPMGPALNVCRRCKSSQVDFIQRQTRSADEGITTFFTCRKCLKRWKS
jgi:DNA-directed RNA polymerase subunit M/transcription elongation factor TFIIS